MASLSGPWFLGGGGEALFEQVIALRRERGASHLFSADVAECERRLQLDERAAHFVARSDEGEVMGALRLLASPFELAELGDEVAHAAEAYSRHLEISRLVCRRDRGEGRLAARLLFAAGSWASRLRGCTGLIAVCAPDRARVFRRYGMRPVLDRPVRLRYRPPSPYLLLQADFDSLRAAMRRLLEPFPSQGSHRPMGGKSLSSR
jgi:hypothetical protein